MKISLNWLKNYIELKKSPEELAQILTMAGLEVEEIATLGNVPEGVVVAKILSREKHPNSDHLSICQVDAGNGNVSQIVCGAPNCDAGNVVPLATLGTVFKEADGSDFVIKKAKLRGVESFGMMCSARELGLSEDHDGLMILPADWTLGDPLGKYIEKDTVYTVEITPNRPDWLSHWGVARDVWALCGGRRSFPNSTLPSVSGFEDWSMLVSVQAPDLCPEYTARVIRGVKVGESPEWLKKRLNLTLSASNFLKKYKQYNYTTEDTFFHADSWSKYVNQSFSLSISYRIGELSASVKKAERSISNDDVKGGGSGESSGSSE